MIGNPTPVSYRPRETRREDLLRAQQLRELKLQKEAAKAARKA